MRASASDLVNRFGADASGIGNQPDLPAIFPDAEVPIVRQGEGGRQLITARWGWPHWKAGARPLTNVRNTEGRFWRPWIMKPEHRCLVPLTAFAEYHPTEKDARGHKKVAWFAGGEDRPLMAFAGLWREWTGERREGEVGTYTCNAFLTTEPNEEVQPIHPKAMPVILRTEDEFAVWLQGPTDEALALQRPLPNGSLDVVRLGPKRDADA
jgi:putative SOS response-associated peptidase YedK